LFGELPGHDSATYLSGILVGHELRSLDANSGPVYLLGAPELVALYKRALVCLGGEGIVLDPDAAVRGLFALGRNLPGVDQ